MKNYREDRLSVKFREWDVIRIREIISACGGVPASPIPKLRLHSVDVPPGEDGHNIINRLNQFPEVERAGFMGILRRVVSYHQASDDALLDQCWYLKRMVVFHAWKYTKGDSSIKVATHDSGLRYHEDIPIPASGNYWSYYDDPVTGAADWFDFYCEDSGYYSHGLNVHSCLFALNNNTTGVSGVCPDCTPAVLMFNVDPYEAIACLIRAHDVMGVKVHSCSWIYNAGDPPETAGYPYNVTMPDLRDATDYIWANGGIVVAGAGNHGLDMGATNQGYYPAEFPNVVAVSGCDSNDAPYFNYGDEVDLVAPGVSILMADNDGFSGSWTPSNPSTIYNAWNGTSFATPLSAGVFALVWSINQSLTNQQVVNIVLGNVDSGRNPTFATKYPNAGVVNAAKSVLAALTTVPANDGVIYPYLNFWGASVVTTISGGVATTSLSGTINVEVRGYCSDPITEVELRIGGELKYLGEPTTFQTEADSGGTPATVQLTVRTATGYATEEYSDILVSSMAAAPIMGTSLVSGGGGIAAVGIAGEVGVGSSSISSLTASASAEHSIKGQIAASLQSLVAAVTGNRGHVGTGVSTAPAITASVTGARVETGTAAASLSALSASATAVVVTAGAVAASLPTGTATATGNRGETGATAADLSAISGSAIGDHVATGEVVLSGTATLPTIVASGSAEGIFFASAAATIPSAVSAVEADHGEAGTAGATLPSMGAASQGVAWAQMLVAASLAAIVCTATIVQGANASAGATSPTMASTAAGDFFPIGEVYLDAAADLVALSALSYGDLDVAGTASGSIAAIASSADGTSAPGPYVVASIPLKAGKRKRGYYATPRRRDYTAGKRKRDYSAGRK